MTLEEFERRCEPEAKVHEDRLLRFVSSPQEHTLALDTAIQLVLFRLSVANIQVAMLKAEIERGKLMAVAAEVQVKKLSIDDVVAAPDTKFVTELVEEWGGSVTFGSIDAGSMLEFVDEGKDDRASSMLSLIVRSFINPDGSRVPKADIARRTEEWKRKDVTVVNRLLDVVMKLNGVFITKPEIKNALGEVQIGASPTV